MLQKTEKIFASDADRKTLCQAVKQSSDSVRICESEAVNVSTMGAVGVAYAEREGIEVVDAQRDSLHVQMLKACA
jgi:hypothetical protein